MTASKKIAIVFGVLSSIIVLWYLFVKETDYCITFKVNAATGTVFQGVQEWTAAQLAKDNELYTVVEKRNFDRIKQEMKKGESQFEYTWDIIYVNDSVTKVNVGIKDNTHSLYNKISAPFYDTAFKKEQIRKISDFKKGLNNHLKAFKVKIEGEGVTPEVFVAYISLKSVLQEKAQNMIANDATITGFLLQNNIKIIDRPYVEVTKWDLDSERIDFNYCFPIDKNTKIDDNAVVKFKTIPAMKGLKATYFGNFRTSDRAWFALQDYAKNRNIKVSNTVLEHFLSNPFNGGEELQWETKIIIPFQGN